MPRQPSPAQATTSSSPVQGRGQGERASLFTLHSSRFPHSTMTRSAASADLFPSPQPNAPLAEQMRPQRLEDVVGQPHLLGEGKPLERRGALGQAALHDPVGPAGCGQDDARAAAGQGQRRRVHRAVRGALRREGHPRSGRARPRVAARQRTRRPSCSWTRCIASTRRSRMRFCRSSSRGCSPSSAPPPRTRPSK